MRQILCDRCELVILRADEKHVRDLGLIDRDGSIENMGDLCGRCIKALRGWMNPPKEGK